MGPVKFWKGVVNKKVGLRTEIIVNIVLLMAAALAFVGILLLKMTEKELVAQKVAGVMESTEILARAFVAADRDGAARALGREDAERFSRILTPDYSLTAWGLYDREGNVLHQWDPAGQIKPRTSLVHSARLGGGAVSVVHFASPPFPLLKRGEGFVEVAAPLLHQGVFLGAVLVRYSLREVGERIAMGEKLVLSYVVVYGAILVGFGVYLLGRTILRPLTRLRQSTREVTAGNLDQAVAAKGPREIAELADSFNAMLHALRLSREETGRHIASLKKTNEDLHQAQAELVRSAKLASVGHLAAGMAHEIGNPLGALVGYLELLGASLDGGREKDLVGRSLAEASRIDRLVRDLLDYARPAGESREVFDVSALVKEVVEFLRHQGVFDHRTLVEGLPEAGGHVRAVRHMLFQVFVNLLLNARDATEEGGRIEVGATAAEGEISVYVEDDGTGMSPEVCAHVFDPFFTTKGPDRGRGLGLAVCHRVIEETGGRIGLESELGRGTRFTVTLRTGDFSER